MSARILITATAKDCVGRVQFDGMNDDKRFDMYFFLKLFNFGPK